MIEKQNLALANGDLVIEDNNILLATGRDIYSQAFRQILSTKLGEYFFNLEEGLDFDVFLGKKVPDETAVMEAFQKAALQVEDFVRFDNLVFNFDDKTRVMKYSFLAIFEDGYQESFNEEVELGV